MRKKLHLNDTPNPNQLILEGKYQKAIDVAKKELRRLPSGHWAIHWFMTQIGSAYYEMRKYKIALRWMKKALVLNANCPMVLWHYAGILHMLGDDESAICAYKRLLKRSLQDLAYGDCGEGIREATGLKSDCRFRIAQCYYYLGNLKEAKYRTTYFLRMYNKNGIERKGNGFNLIKKINLELDKEL